MVQQGSWSGVRLHSHWQVCCILTRFRQKIYIDFGGEYSCP